MTTTKLHAALQNLHAELTQTTTLDAQAQAMLETVLEDIRRTLEAQAPADAPDAIDKLEEQALTFEAKHPKLASLAQELAESLRSAGV